MPPNADLEIEWRDAEAYAPLLDAERSIFAWEWLRRDPAYRAAVLTAVHGDGDEAVPAQWGLHAFEAADRAAPHARSMWRADSFPSVLAASAGGMPPPPEAFDLSCLSHLVTLVADADGSEHLLLSDGMRAVRLDIVAGSVTAGPVQLHYFLSGLASAKPPLLVLRRLLALCESGSFSRTLHPREPGARHWILALRVHDALAAGACQREIAAELLSDAAAELRWRVHAPSVRSEVQRLVRAGRRSARDGYRAFLR